LLSTPRLKYALLNSARLGSARLSSAVLNSAVLNSAVLNSAVLNSAVNGGRRLIGALQGNRRAAMVYMGAAAVIAVTAGAAGAAATSGQGSLPTTLHAAASAAAVTPASAHRASGETASTQPQAQAAASAPVSLPAAQQVAASALHAGPANPASHPASPPAKAATAAAPAAQPAESAPAAAAPAASAAPAAPAAPQLNTWPEIEDAAAGQSGTLPAMDMPLTVPVTTPQSQMPMTQVQWENATTIVHEAFMKRMGLRSAVIAVATAMQESKLINIDYGTYDSLGLFQQRPSAGWGTPAQVTNPVYASDAFLDALHVYQLNNPGWAGQPVWQPAQGVQDSAYPQAYAQWEIQAANIVIDVTRNMLTGQ
jgi:hypothetical protein